MIDEKKYRTEIPNIIDDLGLDPYERTLYVHYKRVCGANGGQCTEGVRRIAEKTKMSVGKVTQARTGLLNRGLIAGNVQHGKDSEITCPDIWSINIAYYADKNRPNVDGWTVEQLRRWLVNCSSDEQLTEGDNPPDEPLIPDSSPDEQHSSQYEQYCSPDEQKKEPLKKEPIKEISPNGDSGQKPPDTKNKDSPPISVLAYRSIARRYPDKATWSIIAEAVGDNEADLQFWEEVVTAWIAKGFKKINIDGMLDWFKKKEIPKGSYKNGHKSQSKNQTKQSGPISRAEWEREIKSL